MGKVIRVTPDVLKKTSNELKSLAASYQNIYVQLLNQARTMGGAWQSSDNLAFVNQIEGFCEDLDKMKGRLDNASQVISRQAANYSQTIAHNIAQIKRLTN
ncbi:MULTISPECIES: WXG100 family type VII secretion target [unclassified Enterococcus]|uniref:WXG100 family type VII secretion target n=1 Tax=unclassified Enterococcus TaxID=2608891 RepID=UPI001552D59E|nr:MULTISPECIES: WXG100 family type VII secretion target [unclassified Enterococcus]MBS7576545.1 WXG100 family type VII secretion target [Enterococcus sp. MMGLQ5-2]MBS7583968.1 WXG100 family type VII secretion target [Enterococcus sp. MMGLQ5-1]NPD11829.1 WXG100 family type VII secretion target [Enterococcus sp. MMGLQ5-1]NPD36382.1 WXG100 family type VII secretion target [Enterococcus sp. MMGLQ5-2]